MRRSWTVVMLGAVWLTACEAPPKATLPPARVGLRLTSPEVARSSGVHTQHVDLPFQLVDRGVNGTALLIGFLQRLEGHGAIYASELSYALQMTRGGQTIECVSKITVDDGRRRASAEPVPAADGAADGEVEYTTTVKPWTPGTTDAWVVDREMRCQQHAQQVATNERIYENRYLPDVGRYGHFATHEPRETTKIVHYDECTFAPTRRFVHRYEHFVASRFSPPDLDVLQRQYADGQVTQTPPLCHEIRLAPGQALRQHIEADIHFSTLIEPVHENEYVPQEPVPSVGGEA
jgi:hypothetical protein